MRNYQPPYIHLHPPFPPLSCRYGKAGAKPGHGAAGRKLRRTKCFERKYTGASNKVLHPTRTSITTIKARVDITDECKDFSPNFSCNADLREAPGTKTDEKT